MSGRTRAKVGDSNTRGRIVKEGSREAVEEDSSILEEGDVGMVGGEDSD